MTSVRDLLESAEGTMVTVILTGATGKREVRRFDKPEVSIGREATNDIMLPRGNVSKKHAIIIDNHGSCVVIDNKSTNGTFVNDERLDVTPRTLSLGDKIRVSDFILEVSSDESPVEAPQGGLHENTSTDRLVGSAEKSGTRPHASQSTAAAPSADLDEWGEDWSSTPISSGRAQSGGIDPSSKPRRPPRRPQPQHRASTTTGTWAPSAVHLHPRCQLSPQSLQRRRVSGKPSSPVERQSLSALPPLSSTRRR